VLEYVVEQPVITEKLICPQLRLETDGLHSPNDHEHSAPEPQCAAREALDIHAQRDAIRKRDQAHAAVDALALHGAGDANRLEDEGKVRRDDPAARPLRDHGVEDDDEETVAVALGLDPIGPSVLGILRACDPDGLLDSASVRKRNWRLAQNC
jgi:hypothetical protein